MEGGAVGARVLYHAAQELKPELVQTRHLIPAEPVVQVLAANPAP
jgi:hypothetical protein